MTVMTMTEVRRHREFTFTITFDHITPAQEQELSDRVDAFICGVSHVGAECPLGSWVAGEEWHDLCSGCGEPMNVWVIEDGLRFCSGSCFAASEQDAA